MGEHKFCEAHDNALGHCGECLAILRYRVAKAHEACAHELMRIRHGAGDGRLTRLPTKRLDDKLDAVLAVEAELLAAESARKGGG